MHTNTDHRSGAPEHQWQHVSNWNGLHSSFESTIQDAFSGRVEVDVLEAGCGTKWPLRLPDLSLKIIGIDSDSDALAARQRLQGDLHRYIHGDLVSAEFEPNSFDLIYCSYVLEHVSGAERVLENFVSWLRPGGILVLKIPDRNSVFGFVTRITPFTIHVWYKRYIKNNPNAGKEGHDPFPTYYDNVVSVSGIEAFVKKHRLDPVAMYKTDFYPARVSKIIVNTIRGIYRLVQFLSFGRLDGGHSGIAAVLRK